MEESEWRLEPEGEAEVREIIITCHCSQCYLDSATHFAWQVLDDCNSVFRHRALPVFLALALPMLSVRNRVLRTVAFLSRVHTNQASEHFLI